uniref:Putative secreted protein n=1 Tax=Ixodes ricinus TaxID=34613 RepID=A0A147BRB5_IXORI
MMRLLNRLRLREFPVLLVRLVVTAGGAPIQQGHLDRGQVHHVVVEVGTFSQLGEPRPGLGVPGHVLDADAGRRHSRVLGTKVLHAVRHRADASPRDLAPTVQDYLKRCTTLCSRGWRRPRLLRTVICNRVSVRLLLVHTGAAHHSASSFTCTSDRTVKPGLTNFTTRRTPEVCQKKKKSLGYG